MSVYSCARPSGITHTSSDSTTPLTRYATCLVWSQVASSESSSLGTSGPLLTIVLVMVQETRNVPHTAYALGASGVQVLRRSWLAQPLQEQVRIPLEGFRALHGFFLYIWHHQTYGGPRRARLSYVSHLEPFSWLVGVVMEGCFSNCLRDGCHPS